MKSEEEFLRLNKYLAKWGGVSRRAGEKLVKEGHIVLNGERVKTPAIKINVKKDKVKIKNRLVVVGSSFKPLYFVFNKPEKVLTTAKDPKGRTVVMDFFKRIRQRIFPVGRLDWDSEGLLLLTNDGEFAQKILHPSRGLPKTYLVKVKGIPDSRRLAKLLKGVTTPFGKKKAMFVKIISKASKNTWIKIILNEGKKRQVRLMLGQIGCQVIRLKRTAIGRLQLGALKKGEFLPLKTKDLHKVFLIPKELLHS